MYGRFTEEKNLLPQNGFEARTLQIAVQSLYRLRYPDTKFLTEHNEFILSLRRSTVDLFVPADSLFLFHGSTAPNVPGHLVVEVSRSQSATPH
jgi:hypothetical protein